MNRDSLISSLRSDVESLATSQGREVGTAGHDAAREYLLARMKEEGLIGYRDGDFEFPYQYEGYTLTNLLGVVPGRDQSLNPILIAAHYDTCMALPGADDNAAAVSIVLACLNKLRQDPAERDVIIAFFDGEEPPFFHSDGMGSIEFYRNQRRSEIHAAVVLDLVGHDVSITGFEDLLFITGAESDPELPEVLRSSRKVPGVRAIAALNSYVGDMSDHHIFRLNKRPFLFLSCGRWEHYHQPTDTPDRLSYSKMASIRDLILELLYGVSRRALNGPFEGNDTFSLEKELLEASAGPLLSKLGLNLKNRGDIDTLAHLLMGHFGL